MANNYDINYDDERFREVESQREEALTENEKTYAGMINESDKYYQAQIDASKEWTAAQQKNQQAQTDFAIEQIEQQKDQTAKDYTKEQSGAYVDWQKESNRYGANAEAMAAQGLVNTGYGESSQVRMYNTYQSRVSTARESYNLAILNYNNAIKDARLQNNSILAEIAYKGLQQELELSLAGFQYKNQLLLEQAEKKVELDSIYHARYQEVLEQINKENALAEQIRQYNEQMAEQKRQFEIEQQAEADRLAEEKRQFDIAYNASNSGSGSGGDSASITKSSGSGLSVAEIAEKERRAAAMAAGIEADIASGTMNPFRNLLETKTAVANMRKSSTSNSSSKSTQNIEVTTNYYRGELNPDARTYGTFDNGYQPKGISGYGTVSKTGDTIDVRTKYVYGPNAGKAVTVKQNVWETPDGRLWYWDGTKNKYINYYSAKR